MTSGGDKLKNYLRDRVVIDAEPQSRSVNTKAR